MPLRSGSRVRSPHQDKMKYLDEYRDADLAQKIAREIHRATTRAWNIMEVCGGQTHAIVKFGIDELETAKSAASIGAAVATAGLSFLAETLAKRVAADPRPCETALGRTAAPAAQAATKPTAA